MKNLLELDGKLLIVSYFVKGCEYEEEDSRYHEFYSKVKPLFDFDRNQLENYYSDKEKYPFE